MPAGSYGTASASQLVLLGGDHHTASIAAAASAVVFVAVFITTPGLPTAPSEATIPGSPF
jgi:uncharacterized membrane protein YjjP (DUF1212 family)